MGKISLDLSLWPVAQWEFSDKISADEIQDMINQLDRAYARKEKFLVFNDLRKFKSSAATDFASVKTLASWMVKNRAQVAEFCAGAVMVIPSPTFRFILSSFVLIAPIPFPQVIFETIEEGYAWSTNRLTECDLRCPRGWPPSD